MDDGASTLMSIRDAAQATGLSPKALRRRIERGTLASVMIGGRRRIPMEALARRGLIASGHDPISGHLLLDRTGPAVEAVAQHLYRLESRVAALEAALGVSLRGEAAAGSDGSGSGAVQPVATRATVDAARYPLATGLGDAVDRHALGTSQADGLERHAMITTGPVVDGIPGGRPAVADARLSEAPTASALAAPAPAGTAATGSADGLHTPAPADRMSPAADGAEPAAPAASDGISA